MSALRIATRKSELALWQANHVAGLLRRQPDVSEVTLVPLTTSGDRILDRSLEKMGGKGLFIKELEVAMRRGEADIAVHSMKDVPAELPEDFRIAAVLERGDPLDALVSRDGLPLDALPSGSRIGSSSLRRKSQLLALRPDLEVVPLRGNINTRLRRLEDGELAAVVLACAGLERLGLAGRIRERFSPQRMLPATAQGVIGIECLVEREDVVEILERLDHEPTRRTTIAERTVARVLGASCRSPLASHAVIQGDQVLLSALVASVDGRRMLRRQSVGDALTVGEALARTLLEDGAGELLKEAERS